MDWADSLARLVEVKDGVDMEGVRSTLSVYPEDYGQVASVLGFASTRGLSLYPVGMGTNPVGPPVKVDIALVTARLNSVLEVSPENLYVSAQAGTPMTRLLAELDRADLFLPADYNGSVGGWASTNAVSPYSTWFGLPRELVLGAKLCTGDGVLVASGSKTTKFSSGYKVWKTLVGSLGWLGVYVELYCRVYPKPEAYMSGLGDTSLLPSLLRGGLRPISLWVCFEGGGREVLGAVFAGFRAHLEKISLPMNLSEGVVKPPELSGNVVLVAAKRGLEVEYAKRALSLLEAELAVAYVGCGIVRLAVRNLSCVEEARRTLDVPVVVEKGEYGGDYWGYHPTTLRRLKAALDPKGIMSPGKF